MKKFWLNILLSFILLFTVAVNPAGAAAQNKTYTIAFKKNIPGNYSKIIANAGGKVLRVMPEIAGLEVQSDNPNFLDNLKEIKDIQAANIELTFKLDNDSIEPQAADSLPVTDIPQADMIDSYWDYQWDIKRITNNGDAYQIETGGVENPDGTVTHKAVVGIIDSGIDPGHPDLVANFLGGKNMVPAGVDETETGDPNDVLDRLGHGTHVSGAIAANGKLKGVGPNLGIRAYRIFPANGNALASWVIQAIIEATNDKVDVINLSINGFASISRYSYLSEKNAYSDIADVLLFKRAIQNALDNNIVVVTAAGNESLNLNNPKEITQFMNDQYGFLGFEFKGASRVVPAQMPQVLTVSASTKWTEEKTAFYSNYGSSAIDVAAPGGDFGPVFDETGNFTKCDFSYHVLSTYPTYFGPYYTSNLKGYALMQGTSMAAPRVAGIAGLIKAKYPNLKPSKVINLIKQTASDFGKPGTDHYFGAGEANAYNALTSKK